MADVASAQVDADAHPPDNVDGPRSPRFHRWRLVVVLTLLMGYMGYYFNRSNLSVAQSAILDDTNITKSEFGVVLSVGYGVYAAGKFMNGFVIDTFGGRPLFLIGLGGSAAFTVLFTFFNTVAGFTVMWAGNRFFQSVGWGALVKITSVWFGSKEYGRIMGVMSLSYMMGDAIIRLVYGLILKAGITWQELYYIAAAIAACILVPSLFTLKATPLNIGEKEPSASNKSLFVEENDGQKTVDSIENISINSSLPPHTAPSFWMLLKPLLSNAKFWVLIVESFVLTLIREMFNSWLPYYFTEVLNLSDGDASIASLVFPLFGTLSALLGGYLVDNVRPRWRGGVSLVFLIALAGTQLGLWAFSTFYEITDENHIDALIIDLVLVAVTGFVLLAPYSFVDGVFAMEISGKRAAAATVSMINGAGYIGAIISGYVVGALSEAFGWGAVFLLTGAFAVLTIVFATVFWVLDMRTIASADSEVTAAADDDIRQGLLTGRSKR